MEHPRCLRDTVKEHVDVRFQEYTHLWICPAGFLSSVDDKIPVDDVSFAVSAWRNDDPELGVDDFGDLAIDRW